MRSESYRLRDLDKATIPIGFVGENLYTTVKIDCESVFSEHPNAVPTLVVTPPVGDSYPAVVTRDGNLVLWTVTASDLTHKGTGEIQLSFTIDGEIIGMTYPANTRVFRSITPSGSVPTPIANWLIQAAEALAALPEEVADAVVTLMSAMVGIGQTLDPGEDVTVSYDAENNTLTIGVPRGADGQDGHDGHDGVDGHTPVITAEKVGKVTTIYVDGTVVATVSDGNDGGDPTAIIDDNAGEGDTNKVWSADKSSALLTEINSKQDAPSATGTAGQALVLDNNLHPVWGDVAIDPEDIAEAVDDWLDEQPEAVTTVEDGAITRAKLADTLKADTDAVGADLVDHGLAQYFYKSNTYIKSGAETALNGYDLYKIPVSYGDVIEVKQTSGEGNFWGALNKVYAFMTIYDGSYSNFGVGVDQAGNFTFKSSEKDMLGYVKLPGYTYLMVCVQNGNEGNVSVYINSKDNIRISNSMLVERNSFPFLLSSLNCFVNNVYPFNTTIQTIASPYTCYVHTVKEGDRIYFGGLYSGLSSYGMFVAKDDSATSNIYVNPFTASEDGYVCIFVNESDMLPVTFAPNGLKVDYSQLTNTPESPFAGMSAVAFGTSLTYRAQTTTGYLVYLPTLSGITFDNQGVGSSVILGNGGSTDMLATIKAYSSYSGKRICTIEGFCNDWYQNKTLGTWKDTGETTVCGCVRSAMNYIMSQNANLTVFLILDPYGKNYGGVDVSTTAVNASGLTQFEFYEEIAKVANSLGIPVIKQYAESQISENTPQYISDDIHPTAAGALQSANFIWSKMKQYYPNNLSGS